MKAQDSCIITQSLKDKMFNNNVYHYLCVDMEQLEQDDILYGLLQDFLRKELQNEPST